MTQENASYRLEIFEIFLITVPNVPRTAVYSAIVAALTAATTLTAEYVGLGYGPAVAPAWMFVVSFVPPLVGAASVFALIRSYPIAWGYFLAFVNQLLVFGVVAGGAVLPFVGPADVFWLGAGAIALNTLEVLIITTGFREVVRTVLATLPQTVAYMGLFWLSVGSFPFRLTALAVFGSAVLLVLFVTAVAEYMVTVNIDARGFDFSAALTQRTELALDEGVRVRRPVQKLRITNEEDRLEFLAPYFHPGLVSKIGGGELTRRVTENLSKAGVGSFLKPPTAHKSDPVDPDAVGAILETQPDSLGEDCAEASGLVTVESGEMSFRARRYGDTKVVLFDSERYDDVEFGVYERMHDAETEVLVDCHASHGARNLRAGTVEAEQFRAALSDVLAKVDDAAQHQYAAGFADLPGEIPGFALVERVDERTTLLLGFDANNVSEEVQELKRELEGEFETVILLTTDTHASPFDIDDQPRVADLRTAVGRARDTVSSASVRTGSTLSPETRVFGDYYVRLLDSFNISARFFIASLGVIYLYLTTLILLV
jgi:predicted neutral ceramidase superfamily lipid hydrolase